MKNAAQWLNAVGEAAGTDMFALTNPPGCCTEAVIKEIQADARADLFTAADIAPLLIEHPNCGCGNCERKRAFKAQHKLKLSTVAQPSREHPVLEQQSAGASGIE